MAETPQQLLARAQAQLAKLKAQETKLKAEEAAAKKKASADRAAAVTAERLATSPTAQEAARTTAVLKAYTEKVKSGLVPNAKGATGVTGITGAGAQTYTASDGTTFTDPQAYSTYQASLNLKATTATTAAQEAARTAEEKRREGQSAYSLLFSEFERYGMAALVEPLKQFIEDGISPAEFTLRLRETDAYKKRFAANAQRVGKGLRALSEAEYITMEDQYQNVMRNYGLPESYYKRGDLGRQEGFEKLIGFDVDSVELEDRILTAQDRVLKSNPEVLDSLKKFYPEINNGDILAYVLDPVNGKDVIKRKVTAAEIGSGAMQAKLNITGQRAEELGAAGVNKSTAQEGFNVIGGGLERGSQLASIYGENPYTQTTAETEVFKLQGSTEARKQRQKVAGLEEATFGKKTGVSSSALSRDRAGAY
jgi:hypothetical protein